ncbi:MAG: MBL fold metallo-hydrolase [Firmicutes bacterium]|nr:MBL fold metallo-hydrolase [Bacillota bacterium]
MAAALRHIRGNTYYLPGTTNVGVVVNGNQCVIIDTGRDRRYGKQIASILKKEGLKAGGVINTHGHADHYGGNGAFAGVRIYASAIEKTMMENPILEPMFLFSAAPVKELQNPVLMAEASRVDAVITPGKCTIDGIDLEVVALPGHCLGQIGIVTADGVCFCGDAYISARIVDSYGMPFTVDVTLALETLNRLKQSKYACYVPSHSVISSAPAAEIQRNITAMENTLDLILDLLRKKTYSREEIVAYYMAVRKRKQNTLQYALDYSTVSACLTHLHARKKVTHYIKEGKMFWQRED